MIVAEILILLAGVALMVWLHRKQMAALADFFTVRLKAQDDAEEERRIALYKMQKATSRTVAVSEKAVRKMADEARALHEDTRLAHQRVDALARDVKGGQ